MTNAIVSTSSSNNNNLVINRDDPKNGAIEVPVSMLLSESKAGRTSFVSRKAFKELFGDAKVGSSELKRLYVATRNAVGTARKQVAAALIADPETILGAITPKMRKDRKTGERSQIGWRIEIDDKEVVPEKKADPKSGKGIASMVKNLDAEERAKFIAELKGESSEFDMLFAGAK